MKCSIACVSVVRTGLNKADVRGIIHFHMPKTAENYVQEIGRAGRDGEPAHCHVFLDTSDLWFLRSHSYSDGVDRINIKKLLRLLLLFSAHPSELESRCRRAVAAVRQGGQQLVTQAELCTTRLVTLPIKPTERELDIKETVIATIVSYLELADNPFIEQLAPIDATCTIKIWSKSLHNEDPLLAAAVAAGRRGARSGFLTFDTATVANALGLSPTDVIRGLCDLRWAKKIAFMSEDKAYCIRLIRIPTDAEFSATVDAVAEAVKTLEQTQLAKITFLYETLSAACDAREVAAKCAESGELSTNTGSENSALYMTKTEPSAGGTPNPGATMSASIHRSLRLYFDSQDLPTQATANPNLGAQALTAQVEKQIRLDVRSLLAQQSGTDSMLTSARAVARILHGISSPQYPAYAWSSHSFWRRYSEINFNVLLELCQSCIVSFLTKRH